MVNGLHLYLFTQPVSGYRQVIIMPLVQRKKTLLGLYKFPHISLTTCLFLLKKWVSLCKVPSTEAHSNRSINVHFFPLQILFSHFPSTIGNISIFYKIYFDLSFEVLFMQHLLHLALILSPSSILYMLSKNKDFPQYSLMFTVFFIDVSSFLSLSDCLCVCVCVCVYACVHACERERQWERNSGRILFPPLFVKPIIPFLNFIIKLSYLSFL